MITGIEFIQKMYSEVEETEKLFSTGDVELDELLEKVYSAGIEDGYDYAQKEFGNKTNKLLKKQWELKEGMKNHLFLTDKAKQKYEEIVQQGTGKGAGKGYIYGQASGPNGTRTIKERSSELIADGRSRLGNPGRDARTGRKNIAPTTYDSLANKGTKQERLAKLGQNSREKINLRSQKVNTVNTNSNIDSMVNRPTKKIMDNTLSSKSSSLSKSVQKKPIPSIPTAGKILAGAAIASGIGYGIKKVIDKKKNKEEEK